MPELPEVETIVRDLRREVLGKTLSNFLVFDRKISWPRLALPLKIKEVARHGKYIVCGAGRGVNCLVHLRMTGELLLGQQSENINRQKHERARFIFSDGSHLRFLDQRRFGTVEWLEGGSALPSLGLDPLSSEFTAKNFYRALQSSSRAVKSLLLDQKAVSGIGNIYADESLWMAKIHPRRKSGKISLKEAEVLRDVIRAVLRKAIKKGGFTLRDYRRVDGRLGEYQNSRKAYDREGEDCLPRALRFRSGQAGSRGLRCGAKIKKIKIGGRSSYFCPKCQKQRENRK